MFRANTELSDIQYDIHPYRNVVAPHLKGDFELFDKAVFEAFEAFGIASGAVGLRSLDTSEKKHDGLLPYYELVYESNWGMSPKAAVFYGTKYNRWSKQYISFDDKDYRVSLNYAFPATDTYIFPILLHGMLRQMEAKENHLIDRNKFSFLPLPEYFSEKTMNAFFHNVMTRDAAAAKAEYENINAFLELIKKLSLFGCPILHVLKLAGFINGDPSEESFIAAINSVTMGTFSVLVPKADAKLPYLGLDADGISDASKSVDDALAIWKFLIPEEECRRLVRWDSNTSDEDLRRRVLSCGSIEMFSAYAKGVPIEDLLA